MNDKTCGTCVRYADLHSSCGLVRDFKVTSDTPACDDFYKESKMSSFAALRYAKTEEEIESALSDIRWDCRHDDDHDDDYDYEEYEED